MPSFANSKMHCSAHSTMHVCTWQVKSVEHLFARFGAAYWEGWSEVGPLWWVCSCQRPHTWPRVQDQGRGVADLGKWEDLSPTEIQIQDSKPHQHPDPVPFVYSALVGKVVDPATPIKAKNTHQMLSWISKAPLGSCRRTDLDGLLRSQPKKKSQKGFLGHLALAGRWVACASWGQGFWIQGPKSTEKIHPRWRGSGRPLVEVLGHTPQALKERKLLWPKKGLQELKVVASSRDVDG